jgi:PAS domain S-box-containing protein
MNAGGIVEPVRILLVDDRPENLISLAAVLDSSEYVLTSATSGHEALRWLLDEDYAVIIMDVQMPEMDGFETAGLIKQRERSRGIPIIFMSAVSRDEPFVYRGYEAGAVDYITKPFDPYVLRSKVQVFADLYRKTQMVRRQADMLRQQDLLELEQERARLELQGLRREQHAARRYRDLVDGIQNGIVWAADAESMCLTFASPQIQSILGYPPEECVGSPGWLLAIQHEEDRELVSGKLAAAVRTGEDTRFEHRVLRADGATRWFHSGVRVSPLEDGPGHELRGLSIDVTHLKEAEQAAREATRLRDEFLSIASHELKTPLTPLKLQFQLMRRMRSGARRPDEFMQWLDKAIDKSDRQLDRLAKLVDELLDVTRITSGKMQLRPEEVDLAELIREVAGRHQQDLARASCAFEFTCRDPVSGTWDRMRIEQVFTNLLTNAIRYGAGQPIQVQLSREEGFAYLSVRDHGIGIRPEDQARIFERFERAVSANSFGGLGLGLYIVRQILLTHDGTIDVESEPGKGACFRVKLPLRPAAVADQSPGLVSAKAATRPAAVAANP